MNCYISSLSLYNLSIHLNYEILNTDCKVDYLCLNKVHFMNVCMVHFAERLWKRHWRVKNSRSSRYGHSSMQAGRQKNVSHAKRLRCERKETNKKQHLAVVEKKTEPKGEGVQE